MIGEVFGLNVVTEDLGQQPYGNQGRLCHKVKVKCLGGCNSPDRVVHVGNLKNGKSTKCNECARQTHGLYVGIPNTKEGRSLKAAIGRCQNPDDNAWEDYGGRGITVCDRWRGENGYKNFIADMGPCPPGLTLERKDYNDGYHKDNCEWATYETQNQNRRNNVVYNGICIAEWSRRVGIKHCTIWARYNRHGWSLHDAIFTPVTTKA